MRPQKKVPCMVSMTVLKASSFLSSVTYPSVPLTPVSTRPQTLLLTNSITINIPVNQMVTKVKGNITKYTEGET